MIKFYLKSILIVLLFAAGLNPCRAQYRIPLDSVAKITFVSRGYIFSRAFNKVEVIKENGIWNAYRTELHTGNLIKEVVDSTRTYLHNVPTKDIANLLQIMDAPDTTIKPELFKIDRSEIIDSMSKQYPYLSARQQRQVTMDIQTDSIFNRYLSYVINHPFFQSDETGYVIQIQTLNSQTRYIYASSYANEKYYLLPWYINKVKCYNPEITKLFFAVVNNHVFDKGNNQHFISQFLQNIYLQRYRKSFNWEDIKVKYKDAFKILNKSLVPTSIGISVKEPARKGLNKTYNIDFQIKRLPSYLHISYRLNTNDIANVTRAKQFGDTIKRIFKQPNFVFSYLRKRTDVRVQFNQIRVGQFWKDNYTSLQKYFPQINDYNYQDIQVMNITGATDVESTWLLLPDNTLLLCRYQQSVDRKKYSTPLPFMGINKDLINRHYKNSSAVCLHFDGLGNLIKDYGDNDGIFYDNIF